MPDDGKASSPLFEVGGAFLRPERIASWAPRVAAAKADLNSPLAWPLAAASMALRSCSRAEDMDSGGGLRVS